MSRLVPDGEAVCHGACNKWGLATGSLSFVLIGIVVLLLFVYPRAVQLLKAVAACELTDARLREQALKSAKSVCLNIAEAAGRTSPADRARVLHIARGECCEAAAAVDICLVTDGCTAAAAGKVVSLADEVYAMLTTLARRCSGHAPPAGVPFRRIAPTCEPNSHSHSLSISILDPKLQPSEPVVDPG